MTEAAAPVLRVSGIVKSYDDHPALRGVDLEVAPGRILALLGMNGSGKTTLMSIVAGLLRPDAGRVEVCGIDVATDPHRARELLGYAPQDTGVYPTVSVHDNLRLFGELGGLSGGALRDRIADIAGALGLTPMLERHARLLSGGERRRLHTAMALLHAPRLALLDEPTVGADVAMRADLLAFVGRLAQSGTSVVYSTHYLNEIEELGEDVDVAILAAGLIVKRGSIAEVLATATAPDAVIDFADELTAEQRALVTRFVRRPHRADATAVGGRSVLVTGPAAVDEALRVMARLRDSLPVVDGVRRRTASLESIVLAAGGSVDQADTSEDAEEVPA